MSDRDPARRRTLGFATACAVTVIYAAAAAISGHLSIAARQPILDLGTPPPPYNWVNPPPDLAPANQSPAALRTSIPIGPTGSPVETVQTSDRQILLSLGEGVFPAQRGANGVLLVAQPTDPARLPALPDGFDAAGNAYRVSATYEPGGHAVDELGSAAASALLSYPVVVNLHATDHTLFLSVDGKSWQMLKTIDTPTQVQAQASMPALGYVEVGAHLQPIASTLAAPSGGIPRTWLLIAGAFLILGLEFAIYSLRERSR